MDAYSPLSQFPNAPLWWVHHKGFNSDEDITEFVNTVSNSGTVTVVDTVSGGVARISGAATTDDSGAEMQLDAAAVGIEASKTFRLLITHVVFNETTSTNCAAQSESILGLATIDTTVLGSAPTNGIYLQKADGETTWTLVVRKAGVAVLSYLTNWSGFETGEEYTVAFEIVPNAAGTTADITVYVNGTSIANVPDVAVPFTADGLLTPVAVFLTGDNTGTKWMDVGATTVAGMN
jgi:hypothetical protein